MSIMVGPKKMEKYARNTEPLSGCLVPLFNRVRILVCDVDYMLGEGLLKERKIGTMPVRFIVSIENNTKRSYLPRRKEDRTVGAVSSNVAGSTCTVVGNIGTKEKYKVKEISDESLATELFPGKILTDRGFQIFGTKTKDRPDPHVGSGLQQECTK
jgi:hypothetical protein